VPGIRLVIETDIHADVDDVGALAVAHAHADRGHAEILAIGINTPSRWGAYAAQAVNDFYGRSGIAIGVLYPQDDSVWRRDYARTLAARFEPTMVEPLAPAAQVLRRALDTSEPNSVTVVSLGFHHNLVALLDQPGGRDAIERAVGRTVVMGGAFPHGAEYNMIEHPAYARRFVMEWPAGSDFVGFEVGETVITGAGIAWPNAADNPVAVAYEAFNGPGKGRPSWDLVTMDYAVRGEDGCYAVSQPGRVQIDERGRTRWVADPGGPHRHVRSTVADDELAHRLNVLLEAAPRSRG
jgi:inosine-uridine nucleoside N-ribohydrolase